MEQLTASADQLEQLAEVLREYLLDKDAHRENTLNYLYSQPELIAAASLIAPFDAEPWLDLFAKCYNSLEAKARDLKINKPLHAECFTLYIPLALHIAQRRIEVFDQHSHAPIIGINGGQGSGKTTLNYLLQIVLKEAFGLHAVGVSIDDFYKTYAARHAMAESIHPLFATRSVAGTHDTTLAINTLKTLRSLSSGVCSIPRFDKSLFNGEGDRLAESKWTTTLAPVDVVLFEGWFVAAEPQTDDELKHVINDREREEDPDGVWRQTLNHHLATDYAELFDLLDELIVIQVGGMETIYRNRELQEQKLREATKDNAGGSGAMSPEAVIRFIALYERTTRHMLKTLPNRARIVMNLGESHRIESVRVNPPSDELRGFN